MTLWCTHSTLVPRCSPICWSIIQWWYCTIWSTLACVSGSVTWSGQLRHTRPCSHPLWTSCTSQTLLHTGNIHHLTHVSSENKWLLSLCLSHTETGWHSTVHAWTDPWMSSTHAVMQRSHRQPANDMPIVVSSDHCRTAQEWLSLTFWRRTFFFFKF